MWDTKHNIVGTKEKNRMEHAHIENGRRSTSKESPWQDPWREEKPRSTDGKMERRTGITGHWHKRREEENYIIYYTFIIVYNNIIYYIMYYILLLCFSFNILRSWILQPVSLLWTFQELASKDLYYWARRKNWTFSFIIPSKGWHRVAGVPKLQFLVLSVKNVKLILERVNEGTKIEYRYNCTFSWTSVLDGVSV